MIEVVYEKEKQKPLGNEGYFRVPNNIRQIGDVGAGDKIYIEDYAYTYLSRISESHTGQGVAAVLLGQVNWKDGTTYLFIKSAVMIQNMEVGEEHLAFSEEIWNQIYEECKKCFSGQEIIGWFLSIPGCSMNLHESICKTHSSHFGGKDKILFVMEPAEKEEAFFRLEHGKMVRQNGYYIYYEKNEPMREYLIGQNKNISMEDGLVEDNAVKNFRKIIESKQEEKKENTAGSFRYAMVSGLLAVLIVSGVVLIHDHDKELADEVTQMEFAQEHQLPEETETNPVQENMAELQNAAEQENAEMEVAPQEPAVEETVSAPLVNSHVVQTGDTITSICRLYYGSISKIEEVCRYNNITEDEIIYPGQIILLP